MEIRTLSINLLFKYTNFTTFNLNTLQNLEKTLKNSQSLVVIYKLLIIIIQGSIDDKEVDILENINCNMIQFFSLNYNLFKILNDLVFLF